MKRFWIVRHGESESNAGMKTTGIGSTPLTAKGQQQAAHVATVLPATPGLIVDSPSLRAQQTAQPTRQRFPDVAHERWPVHEFGCLSPDLYVGSTGEIRKPIILAYWDVADPAARTGEGAESFLDVMGRAADLFARLQSTDAESIVVFSHGRFIQLAFWYWMVNSAESIGDTMAGFWEFRSTFRVPNTTILPGTIDADGTIMLGQRMLAHLTL